MATKYIYADVTDDGWWWWVLTTQADVLAELEDNNDRETAVLGLCWWEACS